jgi:hypothetical protein
MSHTVDWFSVQTACTCTFSDWCMRCTKECSSAFPRARPGFQCRAVPARERSSPRGDGGSRDGGVERKKRIQANHTRRATKHGPKPNTGRVYQMEPNVPLHHPVGATNQPLMLLQSGAPSTNCFCSQETEVR